MRLRPLTFAFAAAFAASPEAWAQMSLQSLATGSGRQMSGLTSGLKLGDEAILHAALFADVGYDSNVFYTSSQGTTTAPVLHVAPRLEITNAARDGSIPSGAYFDVFAGLDWREYLTSETKVTKQDALNPGLGGVAEFSSGQILSFTLADTFNRTQQAPYSEGDPITSDINMASAGLKYSPGGGRLKLNLRYMNVINYYEGSYNGGSNMDNEGLLDVGWRWLPKTTIYAQVGQGVITAVGGGNNVTSFPLHTLVGLRGLLTAKLSVNVGAGYSNAFYSSGDTPSGFGNVGLVGEVNYAIDALSRAGLGYRHDFANSPFIGQYYDLDAIYGAYQQMIASRVVTYLFGRYENRRFGSGTKRTDNYMIGGVSIDYMIGKFFLAGASYSLALNRTSLVGGPAGGVDYTKHVLLFRVGLMY